MSEHARRPALTEAEMLRNALEAAPRPCGPTVDPYTWMVDYMDWFFKIRHTALSNRGEE